MPATPDGSIAPASAGTSAQETAPDRRAELLLEPILRFYRKAGVDDPAVEFIEPDELPEPARSLLVHASDMTSTLRRHHGADIILRVCSMSRDPDGISRLVVLCRRDTGAPVEFGAIRIELAGFDQETRRRIAAGEAPLGGILDARKIPFVSAPRAYFRCQADPFIGVLLDESVRSALYGRCNVLATPDGEVFARIVEILPRGT